MTLGLSTSADASFHTWDISEIYTDSTGGIQFIELVENAGFDFQHEFANISISSDSAVFTFPTDLSVGTATANLRLILGNAAYNAAPGAVAADYLLPDSFFSAAGDTINFGGVDSVTFANLPTDGSNSFNYTGGSGSGKTTSPNSPTNLASQVGSVPEPSSAALLMAGGVAALFGRRRK